jgi:hypothetical protein
MELPPLDYSGAAAGAAVVPPSSSSATAAKLSSVTTNVPADNDTAGMATAAAAANQKRVQISRIINFTLFFVMSAVILGVVFVGVPSYGVFGDEYLWMKYQVR